MYHKALQWSIKIPKLTESRERFQKGKFDSGTVLYFQSTNRAEDIFLENDKVHHNLVKVEHFYYI